MNRTRSVRSEMGNDQVKRDSHGALLGLFLRWLTILYLVLVVVIIAVNEPNLTALFVVVVSPLVGLGVFAGQEVQRRFFRSIIVGMGKSIREMAPEIDLDLKRFDVNLQRAINRLIKNSDNTMIHALGGLVGWSRIFEFRETTELTIENDPEIRKEIRDSYIDLANDLGRERLVESFQTIGKLLALVAPIGGSEEEPYYDSSVAGSEFPNTLRSIAQLVGRFLVGSASTEVNHILHHFKDSFPDELSPWAALILFWLNTRLVSFSNRKSKEVGWVFASEYELLAYNLVILADAFAANKWNRIVEVIGDSYHRRYVPKFFIQQPVASLS